MGLFDFLKPATPDELAAQARAMRRQSEILGAIRTGGVPDGTRARLQDTASGKLPWVATLTPAELLITRSHGIRPIASVSATCWMHYGFSWTMGHAQGWSAALRRLREEAVACGANAVLDVKMRTVPLGIESSMDFTLVGTAVRIDGLPPSPDPVIATVPALEFVKLVESNAVPTGIAIGAHYEWMADWRSRTVLWGNIESKPLTNLWELVRQRAHAQLRESARPQGNGVLAHINFSEMFEVEGGEKQPKQYLARHIVIATVIDSKRSTLPHEITMAVDMHAGATPLTGTTRHHQSYASNESDEAI